jgi:hypothetical protein
MDLDFRAGVMGWWRVVRSSGDRGKRSLEPKLVLGVAAAIVATAMAGGAGGPLALGVTVAAIWGLLGVLTAADRLDFRLPAWELAVSVAALATLVMLAALSMRWGVDDAAAFEETVRLCSYAGILLLVGLLARPGSAPSWLAGVALGGTAVALIALAARVIGFGDDADLARELPNAAERLSYPLGYWNALGYLMAMALAPLAYLALVARAATARAAVAGSVPVVLVLFLTSSRGALLAAILALVAVLWMAAERRRLLAAAAATLPAWLLAVGFASLHREALDPISGSSGWALAVGLAAAAAAFGAQLLFARLDRARAPDGGRWQPGARGLAALAVVAAAVAVLAGPSALIGEFRAAPPERTSEALLSGSGRVSFWGAALDAFAEDPARGVGAGGYQSYWASNGDLQVAVRNAHSLELETLAELGLPGALALAALLLAVLAAAWRRARSPAPGERGAVGAALGILLAGLVAVTFDWTWQVPAAILPFLLSVGLLGGAALRTAEGRRAGSAGPSNIFRGAVVFAAIATIWAGGVLAAAAAELSRSEDRLAVGDLSGAAEHARTAAEIEPWSAEPNVQLATIELAASNLEAARRRAERAVRLAPQDPLPWLLLGRVQAELGNTFTAYSYLRRAGALGYERLRLPLGEN